MLRSSPSVRGLLLPVFLLLQGCVANKAAGPRAPVAKTAQASVAKPVASAPPPPAKPRRSLEELEKDPEYKYYFREKRLFDSAMERSAVFASSHPGARLAVLLFFSYAPTRVALERLQAEVKALFPRVYETARLRAHLVVDPSVPEEMRPALDQQLKASERALALVPAAPGVPTLTLFVDGPISFKDEEAPAMLEVRGQSFYAEEHIRTASSTVRAVWSDTARQALPAVKFTFETKDSYYDHDAQPKLRLSAEHGHFLRPEVARARHLTQAGELLAAKVVELLSAQRAASAPAASTASPEAKLERLMHEFLRQPRLNNDTARPLQSALNEWMAMPVPEAYSSWIDNSTDSAFKAGVAGCELDRGAPEAME